MLRSNASVLLYPCRFPSGPRKGDPARRRTDLQRSKSIIGILMKRVCQNLLVPALDAGLQKDRPYQSDFYRAGFNAIPRQAREQDSFDTPLTLLMLPCLLTLQTKTSAGNRHFSSRFRTDVRYPYLPFQRNSPYGRLHRNA